MGCNKQELITKEREIDYAIFKFGKWDETI